MKTLTTSILVAAIALSVTAQAQHIDTRDIPVPKSVTVDKTLSPAKAKELKETALYYYAFWNTGKMEYLDKAVAQNFVDNTLPNGRPQGPAGPLFASNNFRKAVPDLTCTVNDVLIVGEKVTVRMQFTGTFSGSFNEVKGNGEKVDFLAIDVLHITNGKIVEDWHLEDNLTLMQQLGVAK